MAVSPRRDFPSSDSPRLIESMCKQPTPTSNRDVCVCVSRNRGRKKRDLFPLETRQTLVSTCSFLSPFPYPYLSFKESFDDRPLPLLSDQLDNLIYLRLSNELVADRYRLSVRTWRVDDARNRFCNGSRANAPTSKLSNYTRGRGNYS